MKGYKTFPPDTKDNKSDKQKEKEKAAADKIFKQLIRQPVMPGNKLRFN